MSFWSARQDLPTLQTLLTCWTSQWPIWTRITLSFSKYKCLHPLPSCPWSKSSKWSIFICFSSYSVVIFDLIVQLFFKSCRISGFCTPYLNYQRVSPSSPLILDGSCSTGCLSSSNLTVFETFEFVIYYTTQSDPGFTTIWTRYTETGSLVTGKLLKSNVQRSMASNYRSFQTGLRTNELKLSMDFFKYLQTAGATFFKVTFFMNQQIAGTVINGTSSQIYKINQPPSGGSCSIDLPSGTALLTYYTITCTGWTDSDGLIQSYEYYCKLNQSAWKLRLKEFLNTFSP